MPPLPDVPLAWLLQDPTTAIPSLMLVAALSAAMGSLVGMGGGVFVVPILTLLFGVDYPLAVGASLVGIVASSTTAATPWIRQGLTNVRLGTFIEVASTVGATAGALAVGWIPVRALYILFGGVLLVSMALLLKPESGSRAPPDSEDGVPDAFRLTGSYHDPQLDRTVHYRARHPWLALPVMGLAGMASSLLGIGLGALRVLSMDIIMGLPIKVATASSHFTTAVTSTAAAWVYLHEGRLPVLLAGPVALGSAMGSQFGTRVLGRLRSRTLRGLLLPVLAVVAFQMLRAGVRAP